MHVKKFAHAYSSQTFKIALTGVMLGLVLLFTFLQRFFPFGSFLKFDFSLIFIMAALYGAGWPYAVLLIVARFFIGPTFGEGYTPLGFLGQTALLIVAFSYITTAKVSFELLRFKNKSLRLIISLILGTIVTIVIINVVNLFLINSLYFTIFNNNKFVSVGDIVAGWDGYKALFFFLPNYYIGSITLYTTFNLILLSITSIASFAVYKVFQKL